MLKTPLCDLLGIEKPVFQGGMAWIADASLASAVSEAGGLGIIAAMNADANWLRDQIHELRARTDKPFGVNVMLMSPFADEVAQVVIDERVPVVVTGAGNPAKYMKAWNEAAGASSEELGAMGTGALRKAAKDGNYEEGSFLCGQIAGMVSERQSAREIVDDLVDGAERVLKGASAWVA